MKTYNNLYFWLSSVGNLTLAWRKARENKIANEDVVEFVIFHQSIKQLTIWKNEIDKFLKDKLRIELHPDKSRIIPISRGIDFVGFRNFYFHHLLRKRNIASIQRKIALYREGKKVFGEICEIYQGWQAYAKWGNTFKLRKLAKKKIIDILWDKK